ARQATLSWSTYSEGKKHVAQYRPDGSEEWLEVECQRSGRHQGKLGGGQRLYFHHARLTDLKPGTRYDVRCTSDGHASRDYYFVTAPADDVPVALLFGGDSRSGTKERQAINR